MPLESPAERTSNPLFVCYADHMMKLHRANAEADWERIPAAEHTAIQRLASRTHGIVTPGNICSALGLLLVSIGLYYVWRDQLWLGAGLIVIGRLCDLLDGSTAEMTHTKSPLGEAIDASIDKLEALLALVVIIATGFIPLLLAIIIGVENAVTVVLSLVAKYKGQSVHPVIAGKLGGAIEWIALIGFMLNAAITTNWPYSRVTFIGAYVLSAVAISFNGVATLAYARAMIQQQRKSPRR